MKDNRFLTLFMVRPWLLIVVTVLASMAIYSAIHLYLQLSYHISTGIMISAVIPIIVGAPIMLLLISLVRTLHQQRQALEDMNEQKGLLLSLLAHDMRSPLSMLKQTLDYAEESQDEAVARELLPKINASVDGTIKLLDQLLQWTRVQFSTTDNSRRFNLYHNLEDVLAQYQSQYANKNITTVLNVDQAIEITSNKEAINIILGNLLSNAYKYSPQDGEVRVNVELGSSNCMICVEDEGAGINPDLITQIFNVMPMKSHSGSAGEKGSGIGLMLCMQLIKKVQGRLWVESEAGKGSRFYIEFPI
jgi:signal transduction histidine kinase